jgi:hypothetical protein
MSSAGAAPADIDHLAGVAADDAERSVLAARRLERVLDAVASPTFARLRDAWAVERELRLLALRSDELAFAVGRTAAAFRAADRVLAGFGVGGAAGTAADTSIDAGRANGDIGLRWQRHVERRLFEGYRPIIGDPRTPRTIGATPGTRSAAPLVGTEVAVATVSAGDTRGVSVAARAGGEHARAEAGVRAGDEWALSATGGLHDGRAGVSASAYYGIGATAYAGAGVQYGVVGARTDIRAMAGVEARADGLLTVGRDGVRGELRGDVLLGGEVSGAATVNVSGVRGTARGGVSYGVGVELDAGAQFGFDRVGVRLDLGATFGLGIEGGVELSVNPREVGSTLLAGGKAVGGAMKWVGKRLW